MSDLREYRKNINIINIIHRKEMPVGISHNLTWLENLNDKIYLDTVYGVECRGVLAWWYGVRYSGSNTRKAPQDLGTCKVKTSNHTD